MGLAVAAWLGDEASRAARRACEEDWRELGGRSLEELEGGRPGPLDMEVGVGGCWGEEANWRGGAIVLGGGVDGLVGALVTTGGVHTPPGAGEDMLDAAAEAKGEKAPKGLKSACSLGSGENG